jgi:hypothetical protein
MANQLIGDILRHLEAAHLCEWAVIFGLIVLIGAVVRSILTWNSPIQAIERRRGFGDRRKACRESFKHSFWKVPDRRR